MKVSNMTSSKGNPVPNQFIINNCIVGFIKGAPTMRGNMFQSYDSNIVFMSTAPREGNTYLDERYWDYSVTTGRYRNQFLGEGIAETRKKIASGEYVLCDLN